MATRQRIETTRRTEIYPPIHDGGSAERPLGELFRDLAEDSTALVRQEIALAKAEMREAAGTLTSNLAKAAVAGAVALVGVLVLVAALVVGLGDAIGNYWLSALIVGLVFLAVGGAMASSAVRRLRDADMKPSDTLQTLREDKAWAQEEVRDLKQRITA